MTTDQPVRATELTRSVPPPEAEPSENASPYWADRLGRGPLVALTVLGFAIPATAYLWFVAHYSLNTVVTDQWDDVTVIRNSYLHGFDLTSLWAQHNENRIFFPNLIVIALSRTTHFNVRIEEFLSAGMLFAAIAVLITAHHRRSPKVPLLYYCPVAALMLSFVQWSNTTWGFQMAWFFVLVTLVLSLFFLDFANLGPLAFGAALLFAVVASYSSIQGLLIWPAGLVLLYHRRRRLPFVLAWIGVAAGTAALYFYNLRPANVVYAHHQRITTQSIALQYPFTTVKVYFYALGDILGYPLRIDQAGNPLIVLFGCFLFVTAVAVLIWYGLDRDETGGRPIGIALILIGLCFAAMITVGRILFGYFAAAASRYTTFDLLVPVGIFLVLIEHRSTIDSSGATAASLGHSPAALVRAVRIWADRYVLRLGRAVIVAVIALQLTVGVPNGLHGARANYVYQAKGREVLRHFDRATNADKLNYLYFAKTVAFLDQQAETLRVHKLSVFAESEKNR